MRTKLSFVFIFLALLSLLAGVVIGCIAGFHLLFPSSSSSFSLLNTRPLHVTAVLSWIIMASTGVVYYHFRKNINKWLVATHLLLFLLAGLGIFYSYIMGYFGGREYFEFPPLLAIPFFLGWIIFAVNVLPHLFKNLKRQPVYYWMWIAGIFFFGMAFIENYLWVIPFFNLDLIKDMTVQWKGMGSLVGGWNMLVYGTSLWVMHRTSKDDRIAFGSLSFAMFFLGLTNLMFNWGHHTYIIPAKFWVREIAYLISMTELIILGKIIYDWRKKVNHPQRLHVKFMASADFWIFVNLILAILMSIPVLNVYTHGTFVTVAHSMGTTIGINTLILLSMITFLISKGNLYNAWSIRITKRGLELLNVSLFIFWVSLIIAGVIKGYLTYHGDLSFPEIMDRIFPFLLVFLVAGIALMASLIMITAPLLLFLLQTVPRQKRHYEVKIGIK